MTDATIGNGGFSGTVADTWTPPLVTSLGGMQLELDSVALSFVQNTFTQCELHGKATLPFFEVPVEVEIGVNLDGSFAVKLDSASGLLTLVKPGRPRARGSQPRLRMGSRHAYGRAERQDQAARRRARLARASTSASCRSTPTATSRSTVAGSTSATATALDFHGFKVEITRIGFGKNDDGGKWVGFSGALKLVDEFSAGASVDGLKVIWYEDGSHDPHITLDGVGVELLVPDAVSFKGTVAYHEVSQPGRHRPSTSSTATSS